jgi:hypothetical protein
VSQTRHAHHSSTHGTFLDQKRARNIRFSILPWKFIVSPVFVDDWLDLHFHVRARLLDRCLLRIGKSSASSWKSVIGRAGAAWVDELPLSQMPLQKPQLSVMACF